MGGTGPDRREAAAGVRGSVDRGIVCAVGRTVGNSRAALQVGTVRDVPQPLYSSQLGAQCINVRAAAALLRTVDSLIIERHVVGSCKDWSYFGDLHVSTDLGLLQDAAYDISSRGSTARLAANTAL